MGQTTSNLFKPNAKFEKCKRCHLIRDYLNEFQVCNSCCKQMEQATPNGFKPNYKFEKCKRCYGQRREGRDYLNGFQVCNSCCKQMEQTTPSGFKPNYKYEKCKRCYFVRDCLNEFEFAIHAAKSIARDVILMIRKKII